MKIIHTLKFQFITFLSIFIIAIVVINSFLGSRQLTKAVEETFAVQGEYIAERAASLINGDAFERLSRSLNKNDPYYETTRVELFEIKKATGCLYLYTMSHIEGDIWQFVIDGSAEPDDEEEFSDIGEREDTSNYDVAFRRIISSEKTETSHLVKQDEWGWLVSTYAPIKNSSGKMVGVLGCDFDGAPLHNAVLAGQIQTIYFGGISLLVGLALTIFLLKLIFSRLNNIKLILQEISHGEGDLTRRIKIEKDDEIGELSDYFNLTLEKIKKLIIVIKSESAKLFNIGNDLADNMQQIVREVHQITANIQSIKEKVTSQSASVTQTHSTMENVTSNIEKLGKNVEIQTASVAESSSAVEQMLANIKSVTETLIRNSENVEELIIVSDEGRNSLQKVIHDIQEIARESEGILQINAVMENIASQTNLLSMNAAIEAAHAGEAGKGFAVVAGEIRKLANSSSEQSKTIADVLRRIKTAIDTITSSTNTVMEKFEAIDQRVRTVSDQETNIRNAMEEQGQGSKRILEALSTLNEQTVLVRQGSERMLDGSKDVIHESKNLERATIEISGGMNEMSTGANEINSAIENASEISKKNKEYINILFEEVSKFKVD
jgi:methyl-accepting chemotaxis protein